MGSFGVRLPSRTKEQRERVKLHSLFPCQTEGPIQAQREREGEKVKERVQGRKESRVCRLICDAAFSGLKPEVVETAKVPNDPLPFCTPLPPPPLKNLHHYHHRPLLKHTLTPLSKPFPRNSWGSALVCGPSLSSLFGL